MGIAVSQGFTIGVIPVLQGGLLPFGTPHIVEFLLAFLMSIKFLVAGGQFILFSWYRFLPRGSLVFYILFYYPSYIMFAFNIVLALTLPQTSMAVGMLALCLVAALIGLLPHLGSQGSPALTIAGSSFVGLSFIILGVLNLAV